MRIRTIKPDFWTSDDIAALTYFERLLFIGLWSYVDDNGVGRDSEQLILCSLFPLDALTEGSVSVHGGLMTLSNRGLITRFRGPDGGSYLQVNAWDKHQRVNRPSKPRYPRYDAETCTLTEGSVSTHDTLTEGSLPEQGTGNREQGTGKFFVGDEIAAPDSPQPSPPASDGYVEPPGLGVALVSSEREELARDKRAVGGVDDEDRPDVERVCDAMADSVQRRTGKRPRITRAWRTSARLMIDRDQVTVDSALAAIDWVDGDDFWRANVLSMPTLRKQFDRLRLSAQRDRAPRLSQAEQIFLDSQRPSEEPAPLPMMIGGAA